MLKQLIARLTRRQPMTAASAAPEVRCTKLLSSDAQGLTLQAADGSKVRIVFKDAARAYHAAQPASSGKCVGDRDITQKRFEFAGVPKVVLQLPMAHDPAEFHRVQTAIRQAGFTTFDLT